MKTVNAEQAAEVYAHFAQPVQDMLGVVAYATDVALKDSRYIFVKNSATKKKKGYCTHCHARFYVEEEIKQDMSCVCPNCSSNCKYKKAWLGRKYMADSARFLWFEKSAIDSDVVIASWIHCSRKYNESYENVQTFCARTKFYIFKMGGGAAYEIWGWKDELTYIGEKPSPIVGMDMSIVSLATAIEGTPFQYSGWEVYSAHSIVDYLALYAAEPNLEVLSKNGFRHLVANKIYGRPAYGAINWEARKLHDFFKLTKHEFNKMKHADVAGTYVMYAPNFAFGLWMWQKAMREKSKMTYEEVIAASNAFDLSQNYQNFVKVKKYSTMHRLFNYMKKQYEKDEKHYTYPSQVLITWADYIRDCELLEMDLSNDVVLFPKDLREAHQRTHKLVTIKKDGLADLKIKKRNKRLESLTFEFGDLIIRPPSTFDEIIKEGKVLEHCVGGYADRHTGGSKTIMFIRKSSSPNTPFYTVELSGNKVVQVRGRKNKAPTQQVKEFMDEFEKFLKKPKSKKVREIA